MRVLAIFKEISHDDKKEKDIGEWIKDGVMNGWDLIRKSLKLGVEEKSIIIMPQYVTGFSIGKGFGVYNEKLAEEVTKLSEYHGNNNITMTESADCIIKISGRISTFNLRTFKKGMEKESKGRNERSILNRQKLLSQALEYTMNIQVINSMSKWALDNQILKNKEREEETKLDNVIKVIQKEENEKKESANEEKEPTRVSLTDIDIPLYKGIRKSLLLIMFKETEVEEEQDEETKKSVLEKEKLKRPGTDNMSIENYLENMIDTVHYKPIRYMYFPEIELSNYKEVVAPTEKTEGEYVIEVKRPGNSEYPISMADPLSEILDQLKKYGEFYWDWLIQAYERAMRKKDDKSDRSNKGERGK